MYQPRISGAGKRGRKGGARRDGEGSRGPCNERLGIFAPLVKLKLLTRPGLLRAPSKGKWGHRQGRIRAGDCTGLGLSA